VSIPDSYYVQTFSLSIEYLAHCTNSSEYPVGFAQSCVPIPEIQPEQNEQLELLSGGWVYYQFPVNHDYNNTLLNSFTISVNGTNSGVGVYVQEGYYPTTDWYLNTDNVFDDDNGLVSATVWTPGNQFRNETYFIGIHNSGVDGQVVMLNFSTSVCNSSNLFGYECGQDSTNTTNSPLADVFTLHANLSGGAYPNNNGSSMSFDYDDDDYAGKYAYFAVDDYPSFPGMDRVYIRVTVANNKVSDENGAPPVFAKLGSVPSEQSNQYNISTVGDLSHQLVLPVDSSTTDTWFVAVKLPADFSIWVGVNCANNCSDGKHGSCYCGNDTCVSVTNDGTNTKPFFIRPWNSEDSNGACVCDDIDFAQSYDCTEKNNGYVGVYLLLLGIMILFVLLISVAVPLYCKVKRRKEARHQRDGINYETI